MNIEPNTQAYAESTRSPKRLARVAHFVARVFGARQPASREKISTHDLFGVVMTDYYDTGNSLPPAVLGNNDPVAEFEQLQTPSNYAQRRWDDPEFSPDDLIEQWERTPAHDELGANRPPVVADPLPGGIIDGVLGKR